MKMFIWVFSCFISFSQVFSVSSNNPNGQDTPFNLNLSPLKNLRTFAVLPLSPPLDPSKNQLCDTINGIVQEKLNVLGTTIEMSTNNPIGFGLSGVFLSFDIQHVENINSEKSKLIRVSLSVPTIVTVKKSKCDCVSYVWTSNVFLDDDKDKNIQQAIIELLDQFCISYQEANSPESKKPTFYIYH